MSEKRYPTPHIKASPDDFAKTVLMPGDPLRSKFVAETYLDNPVLVNNVRRHTGLHGHIQSPCICNGKWDGSAFNGYYSYELFNIFDVDNIIRIGSAGSYQEEIKVRISCWGWVPAQIQIMRLSISCRAHLHL